MKRLYLLLFISFLGIQSALAQQWTQQELSAANTADGASYMSQVEKDLVLYINLARLYPQKFCSLIVMDYERPYPYTQLNRSSNYYQSLIRELNSATPLRALQPNQLLYNYSHCYVVEMGQTGRTGHNRVKCKKGFFSECCQYGFSNAVDIIMSLLIDEGNSRLGHRRNLLAPDGKTIGASFASHNSSYKYCTVIDISTHVNDYEFHSDVTYYSY